MAAKILLVEDDNNLREIYQARLLAEGYTIVTAKDGEDALVVAKAEKPNLIISDVMMPRISGFEMLDILRNTEDLKETKVIMLTALGQADDKTRANSLGADRYLVKSQVTLEDIVKAAHELVDNDGASPAAAMPAAAVATPAPVSTAAPTAPASPAPALTSMMGAQPPMSAVPLAQPVTPIAAQVPPAPIQPVMPVPAAAAAITAPAASSMPEATPQSAAEEQAAVGAQIDSFVNNPATSAKAQDDAVLASAMNDLAASTAPAGIDTPAPAAPVAPAAVMPLEPAPTAPEPAAPVAASEPETDTSHGSVPIANKKVIQPLNDEPKQSIHELLAKEEAKEFLGNSGEQQATVTPAAMPSPTPNPITPDMAAPAPTPQAGNVFGPSVAPNQATTQPHNPSDPSNIAL